MALGECLVRVAAQTASQNSWLPLISYKVGFAASVALNVLTATSNGGPLTWIGPIYSEFLSFVGMAGVFCFWGMDFASAKTQFWAYGKGLGGHHFPLEFIKQLNQFGAVCTLVIAAGRICTSYLALDVTLRGREFKQLKERDFITAAACLSLIIFHVWTIIHIFEIKNKFNSDFSICYK